MRIEITIPGEICTDHRTDRAMIRGRVVAYKSKPYAAYLVRVAWAGRAALAAHGLRAWPLDARYEITITMHEHDRRSRDWDNVKGVCDGLKGIVWNDDKQIDRAHVYRGEVRKSAPCVVVRVEVMA